MKKPLKIDIVSDVSCPWCIVGYKSLAKALDKLEPKITPDTRWKPFELNPDMPAEGQHLAEHLHGKYGSSQADIDAFRSMIKERGEALGFHFAIRENARIYNTFNAHRLLYWAKEFDKQTALTLALFELYFTDGGNPANIEQLIKTAAKVGLPPDDARKLLASEQFAQEVREEEAKYKNMGIDSVPTFIINDKYRITGGQPVDTFVDTLRKIVAEEERLGE